MFGGEPDSTIPELTSAVKWSRTGLNLRKFCRVYLIRSGSSAIMYAMTAMAPEALAMSIGSILSTVSAGEWWRRK
jgi:hypothetical protein